MKLRALFVVLSAGLLIGTIAMVGRQRQQLEDLRQQVQALQLVAATVTNSPEVKMETPRSVAISRQPSPSSELLRLRNQVGQLERRKRELAGLPGENQRLQAQLTTKAATGATGGIPLPNGYMRRATAKNVGFGSPEDSVQSFLWSIEHQDIPTLLQFFGPDQARKIAADLERGNSDLSQDLFKGVPGFLIVGRETKDDGTVELTMQIDPTDPEAKAKTLFKKFDGQWRLAYGF